MEEHGAVVVVKGGPERSRLTLVRGGPRARVREVPLLSLFPLSFCTVLYAANILLYPSRFCNKLVLLSTLFSRNFLMCQNYQCTLLN